MVSLVYGPILCLDLPAVSGANDAQNSAELVDSENESQEQPLLGGSGGVFMQQGHRIFQVFAVRPHSW